jgi:hypothetical protein
VPYNQSTYSRRPRLQRRFDMRTRIFIAPILMLGVFLASASTFAHHGEANYDTSEVVDVKGIVADFRFINPHVLININAKDASGIVENWTCEATSPVTRLPLPDIALRTARLSYA